MAKPKHEKVPNPKGEESPEPDSKPVDPVAEKPPVVLLGVTLDLKSSDTWKDAQKAIAEFKLFMSERLANKDAKEKLHQIIDSAVPYVEGAIVKDQQDRGK